MELKYLGRKVDLSSLKKHSDIVKFLETMEPSDTVNIGPLNPRKPSEADFYLLDTMTGHEKALMSFLAALSQFREELLKRLKPYDKHDIVMFYITGERPTAEGKFDVKLYEQYNQVYLIYGVAKRYFDFSLHARIGYDTFLEYDAEGNLYTARDLRGTL